MDYKLHLLKRTACPICSENESSVHINFPDIPIMRCGNCDFMYSKNIFDEQSLENYYANTFGGERHMQGQSINAKVNSGLLESLVDLKKIDHMLDVGTGYGFLLKLVEQKYNINVVGVELSTQEAVYAYDRLGINVINSSLMRSELPKESFDLVTAFEVIEHIIDPVRFVKEMSEYIKPNGYMLIMTDNFSSKMATSLGAGFPKWIPHTHISHFSPKTLANLINNIDKLKVIRECSYTPWEVLARNYLYKLLRIHKSPEESYSLNDCLTNEMTKNYKFLGIRNLVNQYWAKFTTSSNLDNDLMYFLIQKDSE